MVSIMNCPRQLQLVSIAVVLFLVAGCANQPKAPSYYTLNVGAKVESVRDTELADNLSLGIRPIELPDLLDRSGIVTLEQQNRVHISSQNIWAGDLAENIAAVLSKRFTMLLSTDQVWSYPWERQQLPDLELRIRIETMAGNLLGPVGLEARVTVRDNRTQKVILNRPLILQQSETGGGYDGYVAAINRLLSKMADDIAKDLSVALQR